MSAAILADFTTDPYMHQLKEFEVSADMSARALLWQMRSGKSKVIIDTACHQFKEGTIDTVLLFAPNGVHENWIRRELPTHHWHTVGRKSLVWRTKVAGMTAENEGLSKAALEQWKERRQEWWDKAKTMITGKDRTALSWFAFNSESMTRPDVRRVVARIVRNRKVLVVFDESHDYRSSGSKRTKMARALAKRCVSKRILTGTVVTNSPLHAFSQYELLQPEALGFSRFGDFKDHYAEYKEKRNRRGQSYPVLDHYKNLDELQARMAPWSSVVLRKDCKDLPDVVCSARRIELSDEQLRVYRELHKQFTIDIGGERVSIGENSARLMKLQQVVSGFLIDEFGDVYDIPGPNPRLEALSDEVYLSPGKVIIWCTFQHDMDQVAARLRRDGHKIVEYHGRTSDDEKARVRELFAPRAENDIKALVGHPKSGGQGLNFSAASQIMWYSHTFDAIIRGQADERATEIGGKNIPLLDLVAPGVDEYILKTVSGKTSIAESLAGQGMRDILRGTKL